jgi:hypothetical protein
MKKAFLLSIMGLLVWVPLAGADNVGTFFGAMATAQATGKGQTTLNGTLGLADATTYVGGIEYGFSDKMDGRLRVGAVDDTGFDTGVVLGGDLRWQLWDRDKSTGASVKPFDLGLGGFMEWSHWDSQDIGLTFTSSTSVNVVEVGFQVTGSRTYQMSNGTTLTPYGRLNIREEHVSMTFTDSQFPGETSASDSQVALGLNTGVAWGLSNDHVILMGELQLDGNDGLFLGVNYRP